MAEAGLTRGSVYCYFSSKSDLYAQSAARVIHEDRENPARADKIMHDHLSDMDQDRRYIPDDRVAERHFAHRPGGQSGIRVRAQLADLVVRASSQRQSRSAARQCTCHRRALCGRHGSVALDRRLQIGRRAAGCGQSNPFATADRPTASEPRYFPANRPSACRP